MCYVQLRFSCQCIAYRTRKSHEGNKRSCRCNKVAKMRLGYKCLECETDSSLERQIKGKDWKDLHEWVDLPEIVEDDGMNPIDYSQLIKQFDSRPIDNALLERFKSVTGHELHYFFRRGIAFSHRDLEVILDKHEKKEKFFIYTGRGPSTNAMHLGHIVNFRMAKWLSEVFETYLLVMLSADEKYLRDSHKTGIEIEGYENWARENAKDIIAVGCNADKTFLYSNSKYMGPPFWHNIRIVGLVCSALKALTIIDSDADQLQKISLVSSWAYLGNYPDEMNIGTLHFPGIVAAGAFASSYPSLFPSEEYQTSEIPCLVVCALDEDAYLQVTRAATQRVGNAQPSLLHLKYVSSPQGPGLKMSASTSSSVIFISDSYQHISDKIHLYTSNEDSQALGKPRTSKPDPERNVCFQYLSILLEDDKELDRIWKDYEAGKMSTVDIRKKCVDEIFKVCASLQELRSQVTDEMLDEFMLKSQVMN